MEPLKQRCAGILLHITSLPGKYENGDLGAEAYHFVEFLRDAGISVWQTLPLGVPHGDGSPYQCLSAHAGNPNLIDIQWFEKKKWLQINAQCDTCTEPNCKAKSCLITKAFAGFKNLASVTDQDDFKQFCLKQAFWLDDFALFMALRSEFSQTCWNQWPETLKQRCPKAIQESKQRLKFTLEKIQFEQYVFFKQWLELKEFAAKQGVLLFGDIPIFVSYDSVDVWSNREVFKLNADGEMSVVAGVPPDYFSATGQRWGNPHYNWEYLQADGFKWWLQRMQTQLELFDIVRIDHFRGLEASWEIPATEATAIKGEWALAPGAELLQAIKDEFGDMPLVAEDLGIITPEVDALRNDFKLPGMKILQFAFGDTAKNPYLPHNYEHNSVVYTGTHDNDTSLGWYNNLTDIEKQKVYIALGSPALDMPCALIQSAFASVANLAIIPMQDVLALGSESKMNTPGTINGNWKWRFSWEQLSDDKATWLADLTRLFNR